MNVKDKHILLGVTGGIAAYKAVELLRLFKKAGAHVTVAMTSCAREFVGVTTFQVLSENPVLTDLFSDERSGIKHIDIASQADAAVIAPATANIIAKLAHGIADDALSTTMLAVTSPIMVCPSMNTDMYQNVRVQRNLDILEQDGVHILDPDAGFLACKVVGAGRLPDPEVIFDRLSALLTPKDFKDKRILISAGPTVEPIDPVRYISNHSSGKMGYAIAEAAEKRGAEVTLVSGPVNLMPPIGVDLKPVETCHQMKDEMLSHLEIADIIIKVAAVADYKPSHPKQGKIKKQKDNQELVVEMEENPDILKLIGKSKQEDQFLVGFAAETHDLEKNAIAKISKKNLDMIAANRVGVPDSGFKSDTNQVKLLYKDGSKEDLPVLEKIEVANIILDRILEKIR